MYKYQQKDKSVFSLLGQGAVNKATGMNGVDQMIATLEDWLNMAEFYKRKYAVAPTSTNTPKVPDPNQPTPEQRAAQLSRLLKVHGIDEKTATDEQKAFFGQFIGKTQDQIMQDIINTLAGDKKSQINPTVTNMLQDMKAMYAPGKDGKSEPLANMWNTLVKDGAFANDIIPEGHLAMFLDLSKQLSQDKKDPQISLPYKQDLSKFGLDGYMLFAVQQMYEREDVADLLTKGKEPNANKQMDTIITKYQEKVVENVSETVDEADNEADAQAPEAETQDAPAPEVETQDAPQPQTVAPTNDGPKDNAPTNDGPTDNAPTNDGPTDNAPRKKQQENEEEAEM